MSRTTDNDRVPRKVLVVDDEVDFASSLVDILESRQYEVSMVHSAEQVESGLQRSDAKVALVDLRLGDGSGMQLLGHLRSARPALICVMMTAYANTETAIQALKQGAYDYLQKPLEIEALLATLNRCFEKLDLARDKERAEVALERQAAELRQAQKMEAIGRLAGGIAHDFNNLLHAIGGYTRMAQEELDSSHPARTMLDEVEGAADRAATLVKQLLVFGRSGQAEMQPVDLNEVISGLLKILRRVIGEDFDIDMSTRSGIRPVMADREQVEQIVMNLCVNARDAMHKGGRIAIEMAPVALSESFCRQHAWARAGDFVSIRVSDTGVGIQSEDLDRIFEPFFSTKEVGEGTGLGLAMVYGIVEGHQGLIRVESEPGEGTAIEVYLPVLSEPEVSPRPVKSKRESPPGGNETILVVEDEFYIRRMISKILNRAGYRVLTAKDGEEAVRVFEEHADEIDLALLDVVMPKRSGPEAGRLMRERQPQVRLLFSSGYSDDRIEREFGSEPGVELISKPYEAPELLLRIRNLLDAGRLAESGESGESSD